MNKNELNNNFSEVVFCNFWPQDAGFGDFWPQIRILREISSGWKGLESGIQGQKLGNLFFSMIFCFNTMSRTLG